MTMLDTWVHKWRLFTYDSKVYDYWKSTIINNLSPGLTKKIHNLTVFKHFIGESW